MDFSLSRDVNCRFFSSLNPNSSFFCHHMFFFLVLFLSWFPSCSEKKAFIQVEEDIKSAIGIMTVEKIFVCWILSLDQNRHKLENATKPWESSFYSRNHKVLHHIHKGFLYYLSKGVQRNVSSVSYVYLLFTLFYVLLNKSFHTERWNRQRNYTSCKDNPS